MSNNMPGFYFALWCEDKRSIQASRIRNLASDLDAGYSPFGSALLGQMQACIASYNEYLEQFKKFSHMTVSQVDEWCRQDLIDRGAIEE